MSRTVVSVQQIAETRYSVVTESPSGLSEAPGGPDLTLKRVADVLNAALPSDTEAVVLRRDGSDPWLEDLVRAALGLSEGPVSAQALTVPGPVHAALTRIAASG